MRVLLSINPEFVNLIFSGEKLYEFRRTIFKQPVKRVLIYETAPISRVVGEFEIIDLLHKSIPTLWDETHKYAGISQARFHEYFANKSTGYAIKIGEVKKYRHPKLLKNAFNVSPPQSFIYLP